MYAPLCALVLAALVAGNAAGQTFSLFDVIRDVPTAATGAGDVTGDFNGDGIPDLAFRSDTPNLVNVFFGNGDGTFRPGAVLKTPNGYRVPALAAADFNGDGRLDILVPSTYGNAYALYVFPGNGDGTLQAPIVSLGPKKAQTIVVADFNRDGKPDAAIASGPGLVVQLGNGDGSFAAPALLSSHRSANDDSLLTADFNGDGKADLAYVSQTSSNADSILVYLGNGDGTFLAPRITALSTLVYSFTAADFNSDGKPDLVAAPSPAGGSLEFLRGAGDGSFTASSIPLPSTITGARVVFAADLNGDGLPDIALSYGAFQTPYGFGAFGYAIAALVNIGNAQFLPEPGPAVRGTVDRIVAADFNRDGKLDVETASGFASLLLGNGDGSFRAPVSLQDVTGGPSAIAFADFNADGHPDIVTAEAK